jgi:GT2 family glycosyltransferase
MNNHPLTFCISTWNNLNYLKIAVRSVRENSYFKSAPFIIHAENCTDGTDEWLELNKEKYNLTIYIDKNEIPIGIGGGMNFCVDKSTTEYVLFLHSDFYVCKDWDLHLYNQRTKFDWVDSFRIEPNIFNQQLGFRHGTIIVPVYSFGSLYNDFNSEKFNEYVYQFQLENPTEIHYPKLQGVSGLVSKAVWNSVGGNDSLFAPASWEDMDLFLRFRNMGYTYSSISSSFVWHFGARGSHRLEENGGSSSERQRKSEQKNIKNWMNKWKGTPLFDTFGMISGISK